MLLRQGGSATPVPVEEMVQKFLRMKKSSSVTRKEGDAGEEHHQKGMTIEGKLRNYLVRFLGAKTDVRTIPHQKWSEWRTWRIENDRKGGKPKADTIQNEMGNIRECWKWGMENSFVPFSPKLPFHDENLVHNDKKRRDTWEPHEWNSFARKVREWLKGEGDKTGGVRIAGCIRCFSSLRTAGCVSGNW